MAGVSAVGGFFHITLQYLMSALILKSTSVFGLYPVAAGITLGTSILLGLVAEALIKRLFRIF